MKKKPILFALSFVTCFQLMAQQTQVSWTEVDKKSSTPIYLAQVAKGQDHEFIFVREKGGGGLVVDGKVTPIFTRYDSHLKPVLEKELDQKVTVHSSHNFNGNLFLFTQVFESHAQFFTLKATPIDPVTFEAGTPKDLASFDRHDKRFPAIVSTYASDDGSSVLLFGNEPFNKDEEKKYYMSVWDNKMNKRWERITTLPYPAKFIEIQKHLLSNDGNIYLLIKQYEGESTYHTFTSNVENTSQYKYKILAFSKTDSTPHEYPVDLNGKFVHDATLRFDNSGQLMIAGMYKSNFTAWGISGSFMAMLDKNAQAVVVKKMEAFSQYIEKRMTATDCANNNGVNPAFKIVGSNQRDDGSIDLLTEFTAETHRAGVNLAASAMTENITYKRYDALVISFKKDGSIIYTHLPKKQEESMFPEHISISWLNHGNDLVVFYNDNKKNITGKQLQNSEDINSLGNSVLVMATINETGTVQWQVPYSNDDADMMPQLRFSLPVGTNSMALHVHKMPKFGKSINQFGLLTL